MVRRILYRFTTVAAAVLAMASLATPAAAAAADPTVRLNAIISNITGWIVGLAFAVATLFLTIGGLRRMAAGGDPGEIEKANASFRNAAIGYAAAVLAPVLLAIVRNWIGG
jgi:hypothetical protein